VSDETVIADLPPNDGREWELQCARCGSSCATPRPFWCLSSAEWCNANPMPGRESVERGAIEWFVVERREARS
jgi:hypothetical protein